MSLLTLHSLLLFVIATKFEISLSDSKDILVTELDSDTCLSSCDLVDCFPTFEPADCPENTIFTPNVIWGCCPACVQYLTLDETCVLDEVAKLAETEEIPCYLAGSGIRYFKEHPLSNIPRISGFPLPTFKANPIDLLFLWTQKLSKDFNVPT